jgi:hypothetical protein
MNTSERAMVRWAVLALLIGKRLQIPSATL